MALPPSPPLVIPSVASVAVLRTVQPGQTPALFVKGHVVPGDGGDRWVSWQAASTAPDDGILTFAPTVGSGTGRWVVHQPARGQVHAHWAGCVGDGVTDDSAALLAAMTAAAALGVPVYLPQRRYLVSLAITDLDVWLVGEGTLLWQQAKNALSVVRTAGPAIAVSGLSTVVLGAVTGNSFVDMAKTYSTLVMSSVAGLSQGQVYILSSADYYPWYAGASGSSTAYVFQTQFVRVQGLGLAFTGGTAGQWAEEQIVVGATSGATGQIKSVTDGTSGTLVFNAISGVFQSGEALKVGSATYGTASGAAFVVVGETIYDTYANSIQVQLVAQARFILDGIALDVPTGANPEGVVGSANRLAGLDLYGVYQPVVTGLRVLNGWTRALAMWSCFGGDVDVYVERLPDDANLSEQAYGYGVEITGSTDGTRVKVRGGNCRHLFTTNVTWSSQVAYLTIWKRGNPKHCVVYDSTARDCFNAGFDTHWGCYFLRFSDCQVFAPSHLGRNVSASIGFQNRGFGTTYSDCEAIDAVVGFQTICENMLVGFVHDVTFQNCYADGFEQAGVQAGVGFVSGNHRIKIDGCRVRGDGRPVNAPYVSNGYNFAISANVEITRSSAERFTGAPIQFGGGGGRVFIKDFFANYRDNPSAASGLRINGSANAQSVVVGPVEMFVGDYRIYYDLTHGAPTALFRNAFTGSALALTLFGSVAAINSDRAAVVTNSAGGTTTITRAEDWGDRFANPKARVQAARWYGPRADLGTATPTIGTVTALPLLVSSNVSVSKIGITVNVATAGGGTIRLGVYADNNGLPGALLADAGTVSTDTVGAAVATLASPIALTNGVYWLASQFSTAGTSTLGTTQFYCSVGAANTLSQTDLGAGTMAGLTGASSTLGVTASGYSTVAALPAAFPSPVASSSVITAYVGALLTPSAV